MEEVLTPKEQITQDKLQCLFIMSVLDMLIHKNTCAYNKDVAVNQSQIDSNNFANAYKRELGRYLKVLSFVEDEYKKKDLFVGQEAHPRLTIQRQTIKYFIGYNEEWISELFNEINSKICLRLDPSLLTF